MQAVLHACQLVSFVAVKELVTRVGCLLRHHRLQAVEVAFLRTEARIEIDAVRVDIVRHHRLEVRNHAVQLVGGHVHKLQRQHLGAEKHILLLVHIPVETWHIHLVVPTRLHKERLAVVLYLQHHHRRVVGIRLQLKRTVRANDGMVHRHLCARQHVAIAIQRHLLARTVHHLAMDGDIGLRPRDAGDGNQQCHTYESNKTIHATEIF